MARTTSPYYWNGLAQDAALSGVISDRVQLHGNGLAGIFIPQLLLNSAKSALRITVERGASIAIHPVGIALPTGATRCDGATWRVAIELICNQSRGCRAAAGNKHQAGGQQLGGTDICGWTCVICWGIARITLHMHTFAFKVPIVGARLHCWLMELDSSKIKMKLRTSSQSRKASLVERVQFMRDDTCMWRRMVLFWADDYIGFK